MFSKIKIGEFLLDLIFPPFCLVCEKNYSKEFLCGNCQKKIKFFNVAYQFKNPNFTLLAATSYQNQVISKLITILKYQKIKSAAKPLTRIVIEYLNRMKLVSKISSYILVPIPLHHQKLRQRKFNQSEIIAKILAQKLNLNFSPEIMIRTKNTTAQVNLREKEERVQNVKGCFKVKGNVFGKNILVFDDVFTTGATMKEAIKTLRKAGARKVIGLVVAKA